MMTDKTAVIRELNDRFRHGDNAVPGSWMITSGVQQLVGDGACKALLISTVADFQDFEESNDPHHEHDFGGFDFSGQRLFWKIDYYAPDMQHGSEDPADAARTVRVITIMRADEY